MELIDKWNYIINDYNKNKNCQESIIQKNWENYFSELFNYKKLFNEIDAQRSLRIGSYDRVIPDIILRKDGQDKILVELKQYNINYSNAIEGQLISYLKLLNLSIGIIVCSKIYIIYYDYSLNKSQKWEIGFNKDDNDGCEFIKLFSKENYDADKVVEFISSKLKRVENINKIKKQINKDFVKQLIFDHFKKSYTQNEIEEALNDVSYKNYDVFSESVNIQGRKIETMSQETNNDWPTNIDYIIIKVGHKRRNETKSLYDAVRHAWVVNPETANQYKWVLAVTDKVVVGVFEVDYWKRAERWDNDWGSVDNRFEFVGKDAPEKIKSIFIGKEIPYCFRKPGMASPVLFSKSILKK